MIIMLNKKVFTYSESMQYDSFLRISLQILQDQKPDSSHEKPLQVQDKQLGVREREGQYQQIRFGDDKVGKVFLEMLRFWIKQQENEQILRREFWSQKFLKNIRDRRGLFNN
ncbi:unnamed protein product [Paramecium octaurelia]|uniref:Uncharacterized protein n=1 Tax=Paramecium octaurelia TaxID=43137 RepID=A0A8S1XR48_PAROT|nr:unnamed protein product [Paramecium octaurelia]